MSLATRYIIWVLFVIFLCFLFAGCSDKYFICDIVSNECSEVIEENKINKEFFDGNLEKEKK